MGTEDQISILQRYKEQSGILERIYQCPEAAIRVKFPEESKSEQENGMEYVNLELIIRLSLRKLLISNSTLKRYIDYNFITSWTVETSSEEHTNSCTHQTFVSRQSIYLAQLSIAACSTRLPSVWRNSPLKNSIFLLIKRTQWRVVYKIYSLIVSLRKN